jgi:hypothetical protein
MMTEGLIAATIAAASIISPATASAGQPMAAALGTLDPRAVMVISQSTRGVGYADDVQVVSVAGPTFARPVPSAVPPRPHYVAGYTAHALERMAQRRISKAQVEALVASPNPGTYQDDNDTWLIMDPYTGLIVIINKNAYIVTGIKGQM